MLLSGLVLTIETAICAWIIALASGSIVGVLRTLPSKTASWVGFAWVEFFRNTPLLVQLFLWFFVLPELLPPSWGLWLKQIPNAPFYTAAIGVGLFIGRRAWPNNCGRASARCRADKSWPRPRLALPPRRPIAMCCCRWRFASSCRRSLPNFSAPSRILRWPYTIGLIELTGEARAMQEFSFQVFEAFIPPRRCLSPDQHRGRHPPCASLSAGWRSPVTLPGSEPR